MITRDPQSVTRRLRFQRIGLLAAATAALVAAVLYFDSFQLAQSARSQLWSLGALHYSEFEQKLPARPETDWYVGVGAGELQPETSPPVFSPESGFFDGPIEVSIKSEEGETAHCSKDGSIPTADHERYTQPIALAETTVLRCRTFRFGHQASTTTTHTFLIDAPGRLPVLSMTLDPTGLWNPYTGIYMHYEERGSEWEREAHVELLPRSEKNALALPGRVRIHGNFSRSRQKKSFRFYFEPPPESMGLEGVDTSNVLAWPSPESERAVILLARESDVSRDELFQSLYSEVGGLTSAKMPVFLYLNGAPWGIYYVRERIDEEYLQRRMGPGEYDLLDARIDTPRIITGDRKHWNEMVEFFESNDLSDPAAFAAAGELIDIDNFAEFWLFNIYAANFDWPHHNMYMYRSRTSEDGRWRWICWDTDAAFDLQGFGLEHDTLAWATRSSARHDLRFNNDVGLRDTPSMVSSTLIARKLLENAAFRERFSNRMVELLRSRLSAEQVTQALEKLTSELEADLEADWARWGADLGGPAPLRESYAADLARVRHFLNARPAIVAGQFERVFGSAPQSTLGAQAQE